MKRPTKRPQSSDRGGAGARPGVLPEGRASERPIEEAVMALPRPEKARLLAMIARDLGDAPAGVESTPGVSGGDPCLVRTRIPVWVLEQARRIGFSEVDLLRSYPTLRAEDLVNAWSYVRSHREDVERMIRENEDA